MDLWAVHVKNSTQTPLLLRSSFPKKPISSCLGRKANSSFRVEDCGVFEIRVLRRRRACSSSLVVRAMAKKNQDNSGMWGFYFFLQYFAALELPCSFVDFVYWDSRILVSFMGWIWFDLSVCLCLCGLVGHMVSDFCLTFLWLTFSSVWLLTLEDRSGD
jgi:hypothetical protein